MKLFKWSFHYTALNNKDLLQLCPLYRLLSTPSLDQSNLSLLGFLLPWMWGISSRFLQQSAAAAPYLDERYLLTAAPPDLERGIAPLGPPAPSQPLLLITVKNTNLEVLGAKASTYEFERRHSLVHNEVPGVAEEGGLWKEGDGWVGGKGGTPPARCRLCPPVPSVQLWARGHLPTPPYPSCHNQSPFCCGRPGAWAGCVPPGRAASSSPSGLPLSHHQAWPLRAPEPAPWGSQPLPIQGNIAGSPTGAWGSSDPVSRARPLSLPCCVWGHQSSRTPLAWFRTEEGSPSNPSHLQGGWGNPAPPWASVSPSAQWHIGLNDVPLLLQGCSP